MLDSIEIPVAHCVACDRRVVVALMCTEDGAFVNACTRCEAPLDAGTDAVPAPQIKALGYDLDDPSARGCASGCSTGCA